MVHPRRSRLWSNVRMHSKLTTRRSASGRWFNWSSMMRILLLVVVSGGCGADDGLHRRAISGAITFDGLPLGDGAILLEPTTNRSGTAVGATIRRGEFEISRDQGPVPGSYRVRIYATSGTQAPPGKGQTDRTRRPMVELLPAVYNTRTELHADVSARGANRFQFDLHSGGAG
jgi:hypothetical protein